MPPKKPSRPRASKSTSMLQEENTEPQSEHGQDAGDPVGQARIDTIFKQVDGVEIDNQQSIKDLMKTMDERLNKIVSQEFMESKFKQMITTNILQEAIAQLKEDLKEEVRKEVSYITNKVKVLENSIIDLRTETDTIRNEMSDLDVRCETLSGHNQALKTENNNLHDRIKEANYSLKIKEKEINDLEQYTRRNSIRIYGINDTNARETAEETTEKVIAMMGNELGINLEHRDIDIAHRIGRYQQDGNRVTICKFVSRFHKLQAVRLRRRLKGKAFVIREDLTRKNAKLLESLTDVANVKSAWSEEGRIIALLENDNTVTVTIATDLSKPLTNGRRDDRR